MAPTVDLQKPAAQWLPELTDAQLADAITQTQQRIDDNTTRVALLRLVQTARAAAATTTTTTTTPTV
jgi:hypothetical protein